MFEQSLNLTEKISIIKHADIDDANILKSNYSYLIGRVSNLDERQQLIILRTNALLRIQELTRT